jgi:hypothetical protein
MSGKRMKTQAEVDKVEGESLKLGQLRLLIALDALLVEGSVGGAAKQMGLSIAAMSRLLGQIREKFDDPIFVRSGRNMIATPKAEALRGRLRRLANEAEALMSFNGSDAVETHCKRKHGWEKASAIVAPPPLGIRKVIAPLNSLRHNLPIFRMRTILFGGSRNTLRSPAARLVTHVRSRCMKRKMLSPRYLQVKQIPCKSVLYCGLFIIEVKRLLNLPVWHRQPENITQRRPTFAARHSTGPHISRQTHISRHGLCWRQFLLHALAIRSLCMAIAEQVSFPGSWNSQLKPSISRLRVRYHWLKVR